VTVRVATAPGTTRVEQIMGMPITIDVRAPVDPSVVGDVFAWLRWVDGLFSTYDESSEIMRLNRGELTLEDAHPHVREVLAWCDDLRRQTDGFFDVRAAGGGIDPSGLVKGWAVDRSADILDEAGVSDFAINAGGDIRVRGRAVPEPSWRVGILHPLEHDRVAAVVDASDLAIATSGAYARGDHVLDPHTHRPPQGVLSVTIAGPDLATADACATAAFAMGRAGARWAARLRAYEALAILDDGTMLSTPGFPAA
jgi:thiamine biosynthesis lipoprotein